MAIKVRYSDGVASSWSGFTVIPLVLVIHSISESYLKKSPPVVIYKD
jgi:hypothetical protein